MLVTVASRFFLAIPLLLGFSVSVAAQHAAMPSALRLADVLKLGVNSHPLVEAARARLSSARGERRSVGTLPNPVFTYWGENLGRAPLNATTPLDKEDQFYATVPLEPLLQRWPRIRRADADIRVADASLSRARQAVALDIARAFYRVAAAQVAVEAAGDSRGRLAELVTFNQARVREGVAAEADLIRTQIELDRVTANTTLERVELARARAALAPFLALRASAFMRPAVADMTSASSLDEVRVVIDDEVSEVESAAGPLALSELLQRARASRADVMESRARAAAARAEVSTQRALTVRQVGATFGTKRTAGVTSLIASLSVPIPLFDQNRGDIQRAQGEHTALEQEAAWTERQAVAEVESAYAAARLLTEQVTLLRGAFVSRAEESQRIALAAYQEGAINLLQVLDASRTLADARVTFYRTVFAQRQSLLELNAAVGASPLDAPITMSVPGSPLSSPPSLPAGTAGVRP